MTHQALLGPVVFRFAVGRALWQQDWLAPLALKPAKRSPEVTLYAWEGTDFPPPPWGNQYVYSHRGDIQGYSHPDIQVAFSQHSRVLGLYHRQQSVGIYWTPSKSTLPSYEWAAPMRWLINWAGLDRGLQLTHAAAVGLDGRGLLLAGKGGSGKSTTSLACWHAGWDFVSDDYCWLSTEPGLEAHAVYKTAKLLPGQPIDLPRWDSVQRLSDEKTVFQLDRLQGGKLVDSLELRGIALPAPAAVERPRLRPASGRDALAALSLSTMAQLPGTGPQSMALLKRAARELPAFHLDLCHPASSVPGVLGEMLA